MYDEAAVVVVGMSVREVEAAATLIRFAERADATVAHLQVGDPSLSREPVSYTHLTLPTNREV